MRRECRSWFGNVLAERTWWNRTVRRVIALRGERRNFVRSAIRWFSFDHFRSLSRMSQVEAVDSLAHDERTGASLLPPAPFQQAASRHFRANNILGKTIPLALVVLAWKGYRLCVFEVGTFSFLSLRLRQRLTASRELPQPDPTPTPSGTPLRRAVQPILLVARLLLLGCVPPPQALGCSARPSPRGLRPHRRQLFLLFVLAHTTSYPLFSQVYETELDGTPTRCYRDQCGGSWRSVRTR